MNSQKDSCSAPPLTSLPTVLLLGTPLLFGLLLSAAPRQALSVVAALALGGAWLSLVLDMTHPPEVGRTRQDSRRRLTEFRALPLLEPLDLILPNDCCHFVAAVRFGRRRADQVGHLVLSSGCLMFRGALHLGIEWRDVASVRCESHEIIVALHTRHRVLRFSCRSLEEAAQGAAVAGYLVRPRAEVDASGTPSRVVVAAGRA